MAEIIKIEIDKVVVGLDDGSVVRVSLDDVDFIPEISDKVKVYEDKGTYYIKKIKDINPKSNSPLPSDIEYKEDYINKNLKEDENIKQVVNNIYVQKNPTPYGKYPVNKWIYALLALFLGGLGIHKFYSQKIGKGIVYLLFSWTFIPTIIAFLEFIMAITKTPDENGYIYM